MQPTLRLRGGRPLSGAIKVGGAKNATTKMMIASLLTDELVHLSNAPGIEDVKITGELLESIGASVTYGEHEIKLQTKHIKTTTVAKLSRANRLSILALSPLLHRTGEALVPLVGGDAIGPRPVNFHLTALQAMGAQIEEIADGYRATAPNGLHGALLTLPYPSVGATENIIFAAVLAKGRTHIENAAIEPEIVDIVKFLQQMGAIIEFGANRTITIDGVAKLDGATYRILPDRLEAASYALLAIATDGEIMVENARQDEMISFLNTIRRMNASFTISPEGISFRRGDGQLQAIELETDTYPGFATDWQQPTVVVLTQAHGLSVLHETVYEDRFGYTHALKRMGADIEVYAKCLGELPCRFRNRSERHSAVIKGATPLHATSVEVPDIRAGMAAVIAALVADGESTLTGIHHLERGYENFWEKLRAVGADFTIDNKQ